MLAFNTLRFIGQRALAKKELLPAPPTLARKRLRKVIFDLRIWKHNPWLPVFRELYAEFLTL